MAKEHTPPAGQSFELGEFYAAYAFWLEKGAPQGRPFLRCDGLCGALIDFFDLDDDFDFDARCRLGDELRAQFDAEGHPVSIPFDTTIGSHFADFDKHLNPARRAWVMARRNP